MGYEPVTIREAAQMEVLLFVGLAFVGALATIYWGFQTYQFGRVIRDTPPEPIQSVAMGRTEITGEIVPATRVYDQPFTEGQCIYGELKVKEYRESHDSDDNEKEWQTIQTDSFSAPFYIDDGTGQMLVEPNDDTLYEISEEHSATFTVDGGQRAPEPVREFLGSGPDSGQRSGGGPDSEASGDSDEGGVRERVGGVLGRFGIFGDDDEDEITDQGGDPDAVDMDRREDTSESGDVEHVRRYELGSVTSTGNKRQYIQTVLPLSDEGYIFGGATRPDVDEDVPRDEDVLVRTDPGTGEFVVSDKDEFALGKTYRNRSYMYIAAGIIVGAFILALLVQTLITGPVYGIEAALP